jgi:uncharacterized membrane protein required for colicin V production
MHFNLLDMAVYGILIVSVLAGFYQGLIATSANTAGFFLSLLSAKLFYMGMAMNVKEAGKMIPRLVYYSESAEMLGTTEVVRTPVAGFTQQQMDALLKTVQLPHPVDEWFRHNVLNAVYTKQGIVSLGDYLSQTVAKTAVAVACFLAILLGVYIVFTIVVNLVHFVVKLPALRLFDGVLGGAVGLVRGVFLAMALFMVLPTILSMLPVHQIQDIVNSSQLADFYYQKNFMFGMIKSFIG